MISRNTIDEIKSRIDIIDVVGDFINLKRSGQNYKALSPFTNEKSGSFYVVPTKGIFKDFSSGKGGDAITFVMEHEGMSYTEALRWLAKKYGGEIKEEQVLEKDQVAQSERDSLYIVMNYAKDYYKDLLHKSDEGQSIGLSYFHERGFTDRNIEMFELGYALNEWNAFEKNAIKAGYSAEILEKAGLCWPIEAKWMTIRWCLRSRTPKVMRWPPSSRPFSSSPSDGARLNPPRPAKMQIGAVHIARLFVSK